jgi:hypothetical protein
MSLERLVGTRKFPTTLATLSFAIMELDWFCTGVLKVRHPCLMRAFMNYSACWRSKKALVGIRCLTIYTLENRVAIVSSVIARIFLPYASVGRSHLNPLK